MERSGVTAQTGRRGNAGTGCDDRGRRRAGKGPSRQLSICLYGLWPEAVLDSLSFEEQEQDWRDWIRSNPDDLLYVAELSAGEAVGYALARSGPSEILGYDSELIALHVLGLYQRQGIGRRLVAAIAKELQRRDGESLMLWVLKENRARGFYKRLGGHLLADQKTSWAERLEVAYGWPGIEVLCGQRWG